MALAHDGAVALAIANAGLLLDDGLVADAIFDLGQAALLGAAGGRRVGACTAVRRPCVASGPSQACQACQAQGQLEPHHGCLLTVQAAVPNGSGRLPGKQHPVPNQWKCARWGGPWQRNSMGQRGICRRPVDVPGMEGSRGVTGGAPAAWYDGFRPHRDRPNGRIALRWALLFPFPCSRCRSRSRRFKLGNRERERARARKNRSPFFARRGCGITPPTPGGTATPGATSLPLAGTEQESHGRPPPRSRCFRPRLCNNPRMPG